ncbi:MAG: ABC transporter substrate-binding protein [Ilumatobacteraceae bacterium]
MKANKTVAAISLLALGFVAVACGSDDEAATTETAAPADSAAPAADVCPAKLTIQTDWFPELEHGGTYQLIGPNGTADKATVSYSGPVQSQYAVGGLKELTINTIKFDKANASVLLDGEADMAYITLGDVIKDSKAVPMVVIAKTLDKDPQMVMWDPTQYDITKPEDIKGTEASVLHFPGTGYIDYMIGKDYMSADQSNPSYDGSDAKWVAEGGSFFQQGFATNEIYKYENDIAWKDGAPADVSFYTVADMGFDNYPAMITMMKDKATELDACLTLLVPKMQQAWVDFLADPKPVTDALIKINETHDGFWSLSEGLNASGIAIIEEKSMAGNSPDGTYCSTDPERAATLYDQLKTIFDAQGVEITDDITSVYTNKYCEGAPGR